jgi:hypothetical protein
VLNSCIGVSDYNKQYSLCRPLLPSPLPTLGLTRSTQRHSNPVTPPKLSQGHAPEPSSLRVFAFHCRSGRCAVGAPAIFSVCTYSWRHHDHEGHAVHIIADTLGGSYASDHLTPPGSPFQLLYKMEELERRSAYWGPLHSRLV